LTTSAELISPGYPLEYCDDANCTTNVSFIGKDAKKSQDSASSYPVIRAKINDFHVEMDVDSLTVFGLNEELIAYDSKKIYFRSYYTIGDPKFFLEMAL
jgi:hypothetical protein